MHNPWLIDDVHILLRLLLSMLLGGLIGLERESSNRAAGLRTHILVCLGSTLIMMLSIYGFAEFANEMNIRMDPARLASAVITGIGFLGAGTILFTGKSITGLTTAASLWVVAALGLSVGAGFNFAAIATTILILMTLVFLNKIEQRYINGNKLHLVTIHAINVPGFLDNVSNLFNEEGFTIRKCIVNERSTVPYGELLPPQTTIELTMHVLIKRTFDPIHISSKVRGLEGVTMISLE